ncbi:relaxase/mobilization nuclease domain-containing protein [Chitinophaga sp. GCM10012297]|uniref:Relaxase/mobilization nuclease domain-containing protein n=1 Tax=Chitinophaga chungangae TaxID=2821488 RepID=A0ABS3Y7X1_9BACT|nr:relaxase/mobilization nuclease domain-containing protein [Chitinophaga chungangae]MBO9150763.1 relaxase/mobilization nuclease domain-containing protein [Chitinophaga chungangae]
MIGKIIIGKSFKGCISYCLSPKQGQAERAEVIHYNNCYGDKNALIRQFEELRGHNPKLGKPVMHVILSLAPGDKVRPGLKEAIAQECAEDLGFADCQYLAISHNDTQHQHIHIIANRVRYNGKTVSDSNNYRQIVRFCRKMEQKFNLTKVLNPRRFLSSVNQLIPREDQRRNALKRAVSKAVLEAKDFNSFLSLMKLSGYEVDKGRGIAFVDAQKVRMKGSEIGYSLQSIRGKLQQLNSQRLVAPMPHRLRLR